MSGARALIALWVVLAGARATAAEPLGGARTLRQALLDATVELDTGCSGALAESRQLVVTAYHCVDRADRQVGVRVSTGERRVGWIVGTDQESDQALLFLEDPVAIEPLAIARRPQIAGTVLYFAGHPDHPRFQSARLDRIGRCGSLPALPNALFTSIDGKPGDSGAPLVDSALRIVGLVHGGAKCHIATPSGSLLRLVDRVLERETVQLTRAPALTAPPAACRAGASSRTAPRE